MKFFVAITLIATVASAAYIRPTVVSGEAAEIQEIIAAIQSPSTNPATAAALEQMLLDMLGGTPEPIAVGPAIIDNEPISVGPVIIDSETEYEPISVGPAIIDVPLPPSSASGTPLVQIILNINQAAAESTPVIAPEPVQIIEGPPIAVNPVGVLEVEPVQVVEVAPEPVQIVEVAPEPVQVIEAAPEPVQVIEATPVDNGPAFLCGPDSRCLPPFLINSQA